MLDFKNRSAQKELLDQDNIPFEDIKHNMQELNTINTLLGGHAITLDGLKFYLNEKNTTLHIVEIGCGGGDNLYVLQQYLKRKNIPFTLTGIDIKQECIDFAKSKYSHIEFICADYKAIKFEQKPSVIFSSLFCHHFTNDELVSMLLWMKNYTDVGFFINDLHRHFLAYWSIKILTLIFSSSYLVKNDAPISVTRGFIKKEWEAIFSDAEINSYTIKWKWAFRHLIVFKHKYLPSHT